METDDKFIYPYGKFSNTLVEDKSGNLNQKIIVYTRPEIGTRPIGSLEGIFITNSNLIEKWVNPVFGRYQMRIFEEKYSGKFKEFKRI